MSAAAVGGGGSGSVHVVKSALASPQSGPEPRCFTSELRSCANYSEQTVTRRAFRLRKIWVDIYCWKFDLYVCVRILRRSSVSYQCALA